MTPSDEKFMQLAAQMAVGDAHFYASMQRRCLKGSNIDEMAAPIALLVEYYRVVRETAAVIEAGVGARVPYDPATAKELQWTPG